MANNASTVSICQSQGAGDHDDLGLEEVQARTGIIEQRFDRPTAFGRHPPLRNIHSRRTSFLASMLIAECVDFPSFEAATSLKVTSEDSKAWII